MAVFIRAKRVSDPLDDKVKARLRGDDRHRMTDYASSGSEHDAAVDPSCLSGLVHAFLEIDESAPADEASNNGAESDGDSDADNSFDAAGTARDLLDPTRKGDPFRLRLHSDVSEEVEAVAGLRLSGVMYRRAVMARLRERGYNAGICKSRWESSGGLTAGSYEYIDVVAEVEGVRYIVDLQFAAEFELARATAEYGRVTAALPWVMVARPEEVRQVVRIAAEAAKRSLKSEDLHVPPWRRSRYMQAKWLGPYRRTISPFPTSAGSAVAGGGEIKCRAVGFRGVPGRVAPPTTRIR